jgi:two-component system cell cycle sensor histidine kinase/response regulator CckA
MDFFSSQSEDFLMAKKPTYEELKLRVSELEKEVSKLKQTEEVLEQSEKKYRGLVENIFDGIFVQKGPTIIFTNQRLNEMLGYDEGELIGLDHWLVYHPDYREVTRKRAQARMRGEKVTHQYEVKLHRKDGSWLYGEINARAISLEEEHGIQVWVRDITERKQAEDTLKESEEKYRTILESIEEGYFEVDLVGNLTFFNDALCKITGYTRDELLGMNNREYTTPETAKKMYQIFNQVYRTGKPLRIMDYEIILKDGKTIVLEMSTSLMRDPAGAPVGFRGVIRDITERKKAEEALKESEERFRVLVEESPLGVSLIDKNGYYRYINPKFIEMFGYTLKDIPTGRAWFKKAYPDQEYRDKVVSAWMSDLRESEVGDHRPRTFNVTCKDGSKKIVQFRPVTMEAGDQFVICDDITEQQSLEAQLLQAQKMEAIGTLAGGIAHNFNNLLMSIQGNTSLMLLDTPPDHPHYERLTTIEKSVQSGSKLTSQLLGYARGGSYEVKPISINRIITDTSAAFAMTRKDITLHHDLAHTLAGVKADRGQIEQVVLNIYVNAAEAMPHGGELFITTRNIPHTEITGKSYTIKPGTYILLTIRDTGIGMDTATQAKVFDPFFTTKGLARGTGLGLASVYGIIKAHGGYIDVESHKGKGTTFLIYLPASSETIGEEGSPAVTIETGNETILLVDDEEIILDVGEALLTSLGYTVLTAHGGKEAITTLRSSLPSSPPDLVILDMIMPQMGGGETYDRMKELSPTIKVLLSSGYSIDGQAKEILKRGCNGFLQKPFTLGELSKAIREVVGEG